MMNKQLPKFKNEEGERKFWADNDSSDLIDWKKAQRAVFPNLKPTLKDRKSVV